MITNRAHRVFGFIPSPQMARFRGLGLQELVIQNVLSDTKRPAAKDGTPFGRDDSKGPLLMYAPATFPLVGDPSAKTGLPLVGLTLSLRRCQ